MNNLRHVLANVSGTSFMGLDYAVIAPCRKTLNGRGTGLNPHHGAIQKHHVGAQVMVFQNKNVNGYESMVERRLIAEGKNPSRFALQPRKWGTRVPDWPIVTHTPKDCVSPKPYLEVIFLRAGDTTYYYKGSPIDKADIIGLSEATHSDDYQGGLADDVVIRTFCCESITQIRIDGASFVAPFTFV